MSKPSFISELSIPFLQHSITSFGPEIKNSGAAITGIDNSLINDGLLITKI